MEGTRKKGGRDSEAFGKGTTRERAGESVAASSLGKFADAGS